jgi:DNA-binding transcriptional LysR family regulator
VQLAADEMIGNEFLPAVLAATAPLHPGTHFELRTGPPDAMVACLHQRQTDLVITTTERRIPGFRSLTLARPALQLFVPRRSKINSSAHFWRQQRIAEPLIFPVELGAVHRTFERGRRALRVDWRARINVNSTAVMINLVADGHGVGVGLALPSLARHPAVRALPLAGFEPVQLVALCHSPDKAVLASVLAAVQPIARQWWPAEAPADA